MLSMQCLAHLLEAVANDGLVQVGRLCEFVDAAFKRLLSQAHEQHHYQTCCSTTSRAAGDVGLRTLQLLHNSIGL